MRAVAQRFDVAADMLDGVARSQLGGMRFDGAVAGRRHIASGDAVNDAVAQLGAAVVQWSRAAAEIAETLRYAAASFAAAESRMVEQV